jgi:hypothetical protein
MIEVKKKDRESSESLIRRFSRRVQQSGVLVQTKREMRQVEIYKEKVKKIVSRLKKMGKFDETNFKNTKKKLIK